MAPGPELPSFVEGHIFETKGQLLVPSVSGLDIDVGNGAVERGVSHALVYGGGLVASNVFSRQVLFFDERGRVTSRQGRDGFGPGEYITPRGLAIVNGQPVVWDAFHRKLSFLGDPGASPRETALEDDTPRFFSGTLIGGFFDAAFLRFDPSGYQGAPTGPIEVRQDVHFLVVDSGTGETRFRWTLPGPEEWVARNDTNHGGLPVVFGRRAVAAVAHQRAYTADTDSLVLQVYSVEGPQGSVTLESAHPRNPEAGWADQIRDALRPTVLELAPGADPSGEGRELLGSIASFRSSLLEAGLPSRKTLPAFSDMMGSSDGRLLWIRSYPAPGDLTVTWVGLDASLHPAFHVEVPVDLDVWDITEGHLLTWRPAWAGRGQLRLQPLEKGLP